MSPNDPKEATPESFLRADFLDKLGARLEAGAREYGNESFHRPGTAEEILAELLDVAGWAYVAYVQMRIRLQGLEMAAAELGRKGGVADETAAQRRNTGPWSEEIADLRKKHGGGPKVDSPLAGD